MAKATTRHVCFTLNKLASNFVALENRKLLLQCDEPHAVVWKISYSYSSDFSTLFLESKATLSIYDLNGLSNALEVTMTYFNNKDWAACLPDLLCSIYTLDKKSLPIKNKIIVEKEVINNLVYVKHRIELNSKISLIKSKVNAFLSQQIREPLYFSSINCLGVTNHTVNRSLTLSLSTRHTIAKVFPCNWDDKQDTSLHRQKMIFKYGFLNFANNTIDQNKGFIYVPCLNEKPEKLTLEFHSSIEIIASFNSQLHKFSVNLIQSVIKKSCLNFNDIDLSDHLYCCSNKSGIKRAFLEKCLPGVKVIEIRITTLKRKVALSNHAKYKEITFIGQLYGYPVIAQINKNGEIKVSELNGGYFYIDQAKERLERNLKDLIIDLFSNDREYASYTLYKALLASSTKNCHLLFS